MILLSSEGRQALHSKKEETLTQSLWGGGKLYHFLLKLLKKSEYDTLEVWKFVNGTKNHGEGLVRDLIRS